jgi:hypothetical protein
VGYNRGDDEQFSVNTTDHLVYSRQLAGRHFGFPESVSNTWRKQSSCWICDKSVLTVLLCKASSLTEPLAPRIEVSSNKGRITEEGAQYMKPLRDILPHFREKEFAP